MNRDFECINLGEMFSCNDDKNNNCILSLRNHFTFWVPCGNTKPVKQFFLYYFTNSYDPTAFNKYHKVRKFIIYEQTIVTKYIKVVAL